jgi:hypothetical protein
LEPFTVQEEGGQVREFHFGDSLYISSHSKFFELLLDQADYSVVVATIQTKKRGRRGFLIIEANVS